MKVEMASVAATKLFLTGCNNFSVPPNKYKAAPKLFENAIRNYYSRIDWLYDCVTCGDKEYKKWYRYKDDVRIIIVNEKFGALYTGSVVYGFIINKQTKEESKETLKEMEFQKYYVQATRYIKLNKFQVFDFDFNRTHKMKLIAKWAGRSKEWCNKSYKEIWNYNLSIMHKFKEFIDKGITDYSQAFCDGYIKAIEEYLETL